MKKGMILILLLFINLGLCLADEEPPGEILRQLIPIKQKIETVQELKEAGLITSPVFEKAQQYYLQQAEKISGKKMTLYQLMILKDPAPLNLSKAQRLAGKIIGFFTFVNIVWTLSVLGLVVAVSMLIKHWYQKFSYFFEILYRWLKPLRLLSRYIKEIFKKLPLFLYELLCYGVCAALIFWGKQMDPNTGTWFGFLGCMLLVPTLAFSWHLHFSKKEYDHGLTSLLLLAVWLPVAILYNSQLIGFFAVAALMSFLGFSFWVVPGVVAVGFEKENHVVRSVIASFLMVILFVISRLYKVNIPQLAVFEVGALYLGSFVFFLGLIMIGSRWYIFKRDKGRGFYIAWQVVIILTGLAAAFVGSVFEIGELQKIGGTFLVIYLLEKLTEIPCKNRVQWGYLILLICGIGFGISWLLKTSNWLNQYVISPF